MPKDFDLDRAHAEHVLEGRTVTLGDHTWPVPARLSLVTLQHIRELSTAEPARQSELLGVILVDLFREHADEVAQLIDAVDLLMILQAYRPTTNRSNRAGWRIPRRRAPGATK